MHQHCTALHEFPAINQQKKSSNNFQFTLVLWCKKNFRQKFIFTSPQYFYIPSILSSFRLDLKIGIQQVKITQHGNLLIRP